MSDLKVTVVQMPLVWQDATANCGAVQKLLGEAVIGSDVIVLPEMFSTGFTIEPTDLAETMEGPTVAWMKELAKQQQAVITGSVIIEEEGFYHNRLVWAAPDGGLSFYDKRHLFRMMNEHHHYRAGQERLIVSYKGWRICPMICYDLRFPVWSRNRDDYDVLLYVANWPEKRRYAWQTLLKARAIENQCYVVGVNRVGTDNNHINFSGDSTLIDFLGHEMASESHKEWVGTQLFDLKALQQFRQDFPVYLDAD